MGLVSLLILASLATNEMVIRTIRSVRNIVAADIAYFTAEAGMEDALYELSARFSGYETSPVEPDMNCTSGTKTNARCVSFNEPGYGKWESQWDIISHQNTAGILQDSFLPNDKLIISLYNDTSNSPPSSIHSINTDANKVEMLDLTTFTITFKIPNPSNVAKLCMDNDGDLEQSTKSGSADCQGINGLNEDGKWNKSGSDLLKGYCSNTPGKLSFDYDCDGRENEDSDRDPVILWKITDNEGSTLTPKPTWCINEDPKETGANGSQICEMNFSSDGDGYFTLAFEPLDLEGINSANGEILKVSEFLNGLELKGDVKAQFEFIYVAPKSFVDLKTVNASKVPISKIEYKVDYTGDGIIPSPYYTIHSDGWFGNQKQSITTKITPKTTVPLFDFTIIQQQ